MIKLSTLRIALGIVIMYGVPAYAETATSTLEQSQSNLFYGFVLFLINMVFVIWMFRKKG